MYVVLNIYIYELVTPEFFLSSQVRVLCAPSLTEPFLFTFSYFSHIPWLRVNSLCLLFLMPLIFWTPYLCFSAISLQIHFWNECVGGGKLYKCFQVQEVPPQLTPTRT